MSQYDLSRPVLERVREAADIVQVVGETVTLRKAGRNWTGLCPFHGEKTPSFSVSREKGTYYCFGCKRGGDVIDFVMELEHLAFAEAVERLAERFGVELPLASPGARRQRDEAETLRDALEAAQAWFSRRIGDDRPRAFLERRGVTAEAAADFGLGYAPAEWRALLDALQRKVPERVLLAAGLVAQAEGGRLYDRFRDRVTIPIRAARGNLIAFGGRAVGDDTPKYLNSPETALFSKSHVLFAIERAVRAFPATGRAIVVEGYFDCVALHRAGFSETVATLGTSLSEHHAKELARKVQTVVVCFDGDSAGRNAAVAALRTLLAADLGISVLLLPDGQDPDDLIRRDGRAGFDRLLAGALDAGEFLVDQLGATRRDRRDNLLKMIEIADACPNPVRRFSLREQLARAAGVPVEQLGALPQYRVLAEGDDATIGSSPGEWALLRAVLFDLPAGERAAFLASLPLEVIRERAVSLAFAELATMAAKGAPLEPSALVAATEHREVRWAVAAIEHQVPEMERTRLPANVRALRSRYLVRRRQELQSELDRAMRDGDASRQSELLRTMQELIRAMTARG